MLTTALNIITENQDFTREQASQIINIISEEDTSPLQIAAFLATMRSKGETVEEITGFAQKMRELAVTVDTTGLETIVDCCGTGGDGTNTFNVSTASAIVAAAAGITVAKHSNASITSKCGSSNVLEALGIKLLQDKKEVEKNLKKNSIAFMHAPYFHKSTAHVGKVRKELGIRTIFNFLGPLTNPALPTGQVIGVSNPKMAPKIAEVLRNLGCKKGMVVCGVDPVMDEISICGKTQVYKLENKKIESFEIKPEDFGLKTAKISEIKGGNPDTNAKIIKDIFSGKIKGAKLDIVLLNTAAVLWVGDKAKTLEEGVQVAAETIESGKAFKKLENL